LNSHQRETIEVRIPRRCAQPRCRGDVRLKAIVARSGSRIRATIAGLSGPL